MKDFNRQFSKEETQVTNQYVRNAQGALRDKQTTAAVTSPVSERLKPKSATTAGELAKGERLHTASGNGNWSSHQRTQCGGFLKGEIDVPEDPQPQCWGFTHTESMSYLTHHVSSSSVHRTKISHHPRHPSLDG